ncbi:alpha-hydroxy-acid oxidizing protein, partial [Micromonospora sp. NPDC049580]
MAEPVLADLPTGVPAAVTFADYGPRARAVLAPDVWDYIAGGSAAEVTLAANRAALDRVAVLPRVLRGSHAV